MISLKKRIIVLNGVVNHHMIDTVVKACHMFDGKSRIKLYLNTPGGDLSDGFAIHDLFKLHIPKLTIICTGAVMSAGTVILGAADRRFSLPNTEFLIHYGQASASSPNEVRANARSQKQMRAIVSSYVKPDPKIVNEWFEKETFFSAKQALKVGLIDEIIGDKHE